LRQPLLNNQGPSTRGPQGHGLVDVESLPLRKAYGGFGGGRLETQVKLCAGRLPYFVVILCHKSKREAMALKECRAIWLWQNLGLTLNRDKTLITHWQERLRFLGYQLQGRRDSRGTPWLHLRIPEQAMRDVVARIQRTTAYPQAPEYDVFVNVSAIARGWTNYYRYAHNSTAVAGRLATVVFWRAVHFLGKKHRLSIRKVLRHFYARDPRTGCKTLFVLKPDEGTGRRGPYFIWHKRPKRLSVYAREAAGVQHVKPGHNTGWATGHSLTQRLEARAAAQNTCESCGRSDLPLFLHHPNRLREAKRVRKGYGHVARSGLAQQGKMLCQSCHMAHHHGHTRQ
jgi:hypothetical protein